MYYSCTAGFAITWIPILLEFGLYNLTYNCFKNKPTQVKAHHLPFLFQLFWLFPCKHYPIVFASLLPSSFQPLFLHARPENPPKEMKKKKKYIIPCKKYIENPFPKILISDEKSSNVSNQPEAQQYFLLSPLLLESITTEILNGSFISTNKGLLRIKGFFLFYLLDPLIEGKDIIRSHFLTTKT